MNFERKATTLLPLASLKSSFPVHSNLQSKMSPEQLDSLVQEIEWNLKKDFVLIQGFHPEVLGGKASGLKHTLHMALHLFNCIRLTLLSCSCLLRSNEKSRLLRTYCVDNLYAFGSLGCIQHEIHLMGSLFAWYFLRVMREAERTGQLDIISHIDNIKRFNFNVNERNRFARYLKWMKIQRSFDFYFISFPLIAFSIIGTYLSSREMQSVVFTVALIFVSFVECIHAFTAIRFAFCACIMILHSSSYLFIRFDRLFAGILRLNSGQECNQKQRSQEINIILREWIKRARKRIKERQLLLQEIEDILNEIKRHNYTVQQILHKGVQCVVPGFGLFIVFLAGESDALLKHLFSIALIFCGLIFYFMLLQSCEVYTRSKKLHNNLHGIQVRLGFNETKRKLQILRLIQRTSDCKSWSYSIGFTVGNQKSFSPLLALSSFIQTISIALTFMNFKFRW